MIDTIHDFRSCLNESHAAHDLPLWEELYRQAFPTMIGMHCHRNDCDAQRAGIDRSIVLDCGKSYWIDEKIRKQNKNGKVYSDIALEYLSNDRTNAPGWVCKPLLCDFIAYAIAPLGKGYLLPVIQLQSAWRKHGKQWIDDYMPIRAANYGYTTISVGVPVEVLFPAIGQELRFDFTPVDLKD